MARRIRQNGLAHSPKWTSVCMIHYTCVYIRVGWGLLRRGPRERVPSRKSPQPARIYTHVWCIMHTLVHFGECANPFWRMRQFIRFILEIPLARDTGNLLEIGNPISGVGNAIRRWTQQMKDRSSDLTSRYFNDCFVLVVRFALRYFRCLFAARHLHSRHAFCQ